MNALARRCRQFAGVASLLVSLAACSSSLVVTAPTPDPATSARKPVPPPTPLRAQPLEADPAAPQRTQRLSNAGRYTVCYTTTPQPIPLNQPFDMQVWIYEGDGTAQLSTNVILQVDAGMPAHHHGMNVKPQLVALNGPPVQDLLPGHGAMSDGRFEVRGMLLHMPGSWELRFDIRHGAIMERAQIAIDLDTPSPGVAFTESERQRILQLSPLGPPPADPSNSVADDIRAALLGQRLFFDTRLSSGNVSCATCHIPHHGFTDGVPIGKGIARGRRHTPSLWNVAYNRWYFWDGRADSLWSQALSPIENPTEMNGSRASIARLIADDPALRRDYEAIFGALSQSADDIASHEENQDHSNVTNRIFANTGKAIAAYERRLISQRSPLDRYADALRSGRTSTALSQAAQRGLQLFIGRGNCRLCHSGPNFTDGEFHNTGVPPASSGDRTDGGRYEGIPRLQAGEFSRQSRFSDSRTGAAADLLRNVRRTPDTWGQFKTPTLRNVAQTAPYMHHGQLASLRDVLAFYSTVAGSVDQGPDGERILTPLHLTAQETDDLLAFLESLTDESLDPSLLDAPKP